MTHRLYYDDAYRKSFQADVLERAEYEGQQALILDGTYFYPTSGGQPHDEGTINGSSVVNVLIRPDDGAILHVLDKPCAASMITAEIDWYRRFDHMQQHSGQHILSQSYSRVLGAETVSFHLSAESSTIDLDLPRLDEEGASAVELKANQVIWDNRIVENRTVTRHEAVEYPLRKKPPVDGDNLRLVMVSDFDVSACGGTHVSRTGEVGLIKIIGWERRRNQVRAEFVCGNRALSDYQAKNQVIRKLSALFTTGYWELESSIARQIDDSSELRRHLRKCRKTLTNYQVADILNEAERTEDNNPIIRVFKDIPPKELRFIANKLIAEKPVVSLLASVGERTSLVFAKDEDSGGDMNALLKDAFALLGSGSGGGSPTFAQGSSEINEISKVSAVLSTLGKQL